MDLEHVLCPLCGADNYREVYKEGGALGIVRCLGCGLIYVNPRIKEPHKNYWGDIDSYFREAKLLFEGSARHHRDPNYLQDLDLINKYKPSGNFLDVGTNMGFFLRHAARRGWSAYGVEPSPSLSELARKHLGLNVKTACLEEAGFADSFFDVITMTDVFEHIPQPAKALSEARRILKKDGILFIKVPNGLFNLLKLSLLKLIGRLEKYDIFDSTEHVIHYSQETLGKMLEKAGFRILKMGIGRPIQTPVWHKYVGFYYQYPSPWRLDPLRKLARSAFYFLSLLEFKLRLNQIGYLAPNIIAIARKV
jgi:SAM-dependent methyltransferase